MGKVCFCGKMDGCTFSVFFISIISAVLKRVNVCASISGAELSNIPLKNCSHNHGNRLQKYVDIFS